MLSFVRAAVAALILAVAPGASALPFTGITLFGDSLSDTGNAFLALGDVTTPPFQQLIPSAPYPRGGGLFPALSNGPVWAEVVGSALGLPLAPALAGGTNYAFGGADSGPLPLVPAGRSPTIMQQFFAPSFPPPPDDPQFPLFGAGPIVPTDLYAIWGGGNDIRSALAVLQTVLAAGGGEAAALAAASSVIAAGVANIADVLGALALGGAQHILALNVPDVGLAPAISSTPLAAVATGLSTQFNLGLAAAIDSIETTFSLDVIEVDTFGLLRGVVADPAAFGLMNATSTCIQLGAGACADPDAFFFWDGIHPTAAGHRIVAGAVLDALDALLLPLPGTLVLLAVGAFGLILRVRSER